MNRQQWTAAAREFLGDLTQAESDSYDSIRALLARGDSLMRRAPMPIIERYRDIDESRLAHDATALRDELLEGKSRELPTDDETAITFASAVAVRGFDLLLTDLSDFGPPVEPNLEYFCIESDAFVVPRPRARVAKPGSGARLDYSRRGLLNHRVIPRNTRGYEIELHWLGDLNEQAVEVPELGAALFDNFEVVTTKLGSDTFLVQGIRCDNADDQIRSHVRTAVDEACFAVIWPELTMPEMQLSTLIDCLALSASAKDLTTSPAWVLAGSWHVSNGAVIRNEAPVLDRYGNIVFRYAKSLAFRDDELGREDIEGSFTVPILLTQDAAIAFGICKDFCELNEPTPYPELDVDLIVVGSMGNEQTMRGHRAVAARAQMHSGTSAFVVQQADPNVEGYSGYVLPPAARPAAIPIHSMLQGSWSRHQWKKIK